MPPAFINYYLLYKHQKLIFILFKMAINWNGAEAIEKEEEKQTQNENNYPGMVLGFSQHYRDFKVQDYRERMW